MNSISRPAKSSPVARNRFFIYDILVLVAAFLSFLLSVYLWFNSSKDQGVFVGIWVPSIISLGIYVRLIFGGKK